LHTEMAAQIRIRKGALRLRKILDEYRRAIYHYNTLIKGTGYYLKPVHIVTRNTPSGRKTYHYYGRYWWRLEKKRVEGRSKLRWRYIGRQKPSELKDYPDPPRNPLEGFRCRVDGDDIIVKKEMFEKYKHLFEGLEIVEA